MNISRISIKAWTMPFGHGMEKSSTYYFLAEVAVVGNPVQQGSEQGFLNFLASGLPG